MISSPAEVLRNLKNTTIVYKIFNTESKTIEVLDQENIENVSLL